MSDGFTQMVTAAQGFLGGLRANNNRDWFDAHKATFKSDIEAPLKLLAEIFAEDLSRRTGASHTGKMGRIYRDVRFSKDKSPYNTHVHAHWAHQGFAGPGWLLHIDADRAQLMTGLHALDPDGLLRYRAAVDRDGDAVQAAIDQASAAGGVLVDFDDSILKRVPKPYDQDHPHGALLRRKQIGLCVTLGAGDMQAGLIPALNTAAGTLLPFWHWCRDAVA